MTIEQWLDRGQELFQQEAYEEAFEAYQQVLREDPRHVQALCRTGRILAYLGRPQEALPLFERALQEDPQHAETIFRRGDALDDLGRYEEALASYEQACELDPSDAIAFYNRGRMLFELNRFSEALAVYNESLRLRPDIDTYVKKSMVLIMQGQLVEALACAGQGADILNEVVARWQASSHTDEQRREVGLAAEQISLLGKIYGRFLVLATQLREGTIDQAQVTSTVEPAIDALFKLYREMSGKPWTPANSSPKGLFDKLMANSDTRRAMELLVDRSQSQT